MLENKQQRLSCIHASKLEYKRTKKESVSILILRHFTRYLLMFVQKKREQPAGSQKRLNFTASFTRPDSRIRNEQPAEVESVESVD